MDTIELKGMKAVDKMKKWRPEDRRTHSVCRQKVPSLPFVPVSWNLKERSKSVEQKKQPICRRVVPQSSTLLPNDPNTKML